MKGNGLCIERFFLRNHHPCEGHLALNCTVFWRDFLPYDSDLESYESHLQTTLSEVLISFECTKLDKNEIHWDFDFISILR